MNRIRTRMVARLPLAALLLAGTVLVVQGGSIQAKAALAQVLLQHAWTQTRADGATHRPWPWADHWPVARLQVPRLGVERVVLAGETGNALAFGPGHNPRSAAPGSNGSVVISGHRDTHFRFLADLRPGDHLVLEAPTTRADYRVLATRAADATRHRLRLPPDADRLLLVTCHPFDATATGGDGRYLVVAERVQDLPARAL